jgi:hypothetical protein
VTAQLRFERGYGELVGKTTAASSNFMRRVDTTFAAGAAGAEASSAALVSAQSTAGSMLDEAA